MTGMNKAIEEAKAAVLPFESWERLAGKSGSAYAAFCTYRDYGPERNIRRVVETALTGKDGETGARRESGTECGGHGQHNSGGGNGRRTMTTTRTN
jgi:hypothetical protein